MSGMPFLTFVDTSQGKLASYMLIICTGDYPCYGAPAPLEQAFDMWISMHAQCTTRLHVVLFAHIYRQTKGIRKRESPECLVYYRR